MVQGCAGEQRGHRGAVGNDLYREDKQNGEREGDGAIVGWETYRTNNKIWKKANNGHRRLNRTPSQINTYPNETRPLPNNSAQNQPLKPATSNTNGPRGSTQELDYKLFQN